MCRLLLLGLWLFGWWRRGGGLFWEGFLFCRLGFGDGWEGALESSRFLEFVGGGRGFFGFLFVLVFDGGGVLREEFPGVR